MGHEIAPAVYIDGQWGTAAHVPISVINPANGQVIFQLAGGGAAEIERAAQAARRALGPWSAHSVEERAVFLERLADILAARADEMARDIAQDVGMPIKLSRGIQVGLPIETLRNTAAIAREFPFERQIRNSIVVMQPVGVIGAITPWNYPLHQIMAKVAPALVAGCTVVVKPSEVTPLAALALAEAIDAAGFPPGVFNLVVGVGPDAGHALVTSPNVNMISFTGSTTTGKSIARTCADRVKRVSLELGGKSAAVLLEDGDLDAAVKATVSSCFLNSGQTCSAMTRFVVPRALQDQVAQRAREAAAKFVLGDPLDATTRLGPLVSAPHHGRVAGFVRRARAEGTVLVVGGEEAPEGLSEDLRGGYFFRPTIFRDVDPRSELAQEEVFGPVLSILPYDTEEEALAIANGTRYGLAAAVWSGDPGRAQAFARRMRAGQVDVNGGRYNPLAPFGGFGESGYGRELGEFGLEEFLEPMSIQN